MEALVSYGIMRLAACIYDLRELGYGIETEIKKDQAGHGYARYKLVYDANGRQVSRA
jgi:hypothetical protein